MIDEEIIDHGPPTSPSPSPQPRRRRRVEVVLPTRRQLYGNNPPPFENASSYIEKHIKHSVKEDEEQPFQLPLFLRKAVRIKNVEMLSDDVVLRRIALAPSYDVTLDPAIRDVTTTRSFTSKQWGGNTRATFPPIRSDVLARHGLNDFMYLNLYFNPHAPQSPGAPGLFFTSSIYPDACEWPLIVRLLIRLRPNRWLYVGQYRCTPAPSLTIEEWQSQARKVKQTWAAKVSTHRWGIDIRAKIVLRKRLGRDPTKRELDDALKSENKFRATPEEIYNAFDQGHAFIQSWCMTCVGYDEDFQRKIVAGNAAD